jgi:hypothetical protein
MRKEINGSSWRTMSIQTGRSIRVTTGAHGDNLRRAVHTHVSALPHCAAAGGGEADRADATVTFTRARGRNDADAM